MVLALDEADDGSCTRERCLPEAGSGICTHGLVLGKFSLYYLSYARSLSQRSAASSRMVTYLFACATSDSEKT